MNLIKRIAGATLYALLKNLNLRFLVPEKYIGFIERLRTTALVMQGAIIGAGSVVRNGVFVASPRQLKIGKDVTIGPYGRIFNYSMVTIEDETEIGPGLHIQNNDHIWSNPSAALGKQESITNPVSVGAGVFIGANVTILEGVHIGDYCVVAAGAVVPKSLKSGNVYGGVPAKKISTTQRLRK